MLRARVRMDIGTRCGLKLGRHSVLVQATVGQATVGFEENSSALFTRNPAQTLHVEVTATRSLERVRVCMCAPVLYMCMHTLL